MILRNLTFQNELSLDEEIVYVLEVHSPRLFGRIVQSFLAMEAGDAPVEPFSFHQNDSVVDCEKLLYVVSDPFQINLNSKKNLTLLYNKVAAMLAEDAQKHAKWRLLASEMAEMMERISQELPCATQTDAELSIGGYLKDTGYQFETPASAEVVERILALMEFISQFCPNRLLVLCNSISYLTDEKRVELLKYACYTKVKLLCIDAAPLPPQCLHEVRWVFSSDYDDEIKRI